MDSTEEGDDKQDDVGLSLLKMFRFLSKSGQWDSVITIVEYIAQESGARLYSKSVNFIEA